MKPTIVHCHGCFDMLHPGHIEHLRAAKALGDYLIVSITSDRYVSQLKGKSRPIFTAEQRAIMLSGLKFVDRVVIDDNPNAVEIIKQVRPDIFVKGKDYNDNTIDLEESKAVKAVGGRVVYTDTPKDSSTEIIKKCGKFAVSPEANEITSKLTLLAALPFAVQVTGSKTLHNAFDDVLEYMREAHQKGGKTIIIGNGGSASIASHMAIDFTKNGRLRTVAFNDAAALTCTGNDFGFENGFTELCKHYGDPDDVLIAISSSGKSPNIVNAAKWAKSQKVPVITLSGFKEDNPLRKVGDINFYIPAQEYGLVECSHLAILHSILDYYMEVGK